MFDWFETVAKNTYLQLFILCEKVKPRKCGSAVYYLLLDHNVYKMVGKLVEFFATSHCEKMASNCAARNTPKPPRDDMSCCQAHSNKSSFVKSDKKRSHASFQMPFIRCHYKPNIMLLIRTLLVLFNHSQPKNIYLLGSRIELRQWIRLHDNRELSYLFQKNKQILVEFLVSRIQNKKIMAMGVTSFYELVVPVLRLASSTSFLIRCHR